MSGRRNDDVQELRGLGVALVTPFNEKKDLDLPSLEGLVRFLVNSGIDFLVVNGTTGESATLSDEEVTEVLHVVLEHSGDKPVWLGCGGNDTRKIAQKMEKFSANAKIKGFLSVSPYYNKPSQKGILAHYQYLAQSTPKPILLYNIPGRTASEIHLDTLLKLSEIETIVGVKDAVNDIQKSMLLASRAPSDFYLLAGDDAMTFPLLSCGYQGVISVIGNALPTKFKQMVDYCLRHEIEKARSLHYQMLPLMIALFKEGNPVGIKAYLEHMGLCKRFVRLPLIEASPELTQELKQYLA